MCKIVEQIDWYSSITCITRYIFLKIREKTHTKAGLSQEQIDDTMREKTTWIPLHVYDNKVWTGHAMIHALFEFWYGCDWEPFVWLLCMRITHITSHQIRLWTRPWADDCFLTLSTRALVLLSKIMFAFQHFWNCNGYFTN